MLRPVIYPVYLLRFFIGYEFVWSVRTVTPDVWSVVSRPHCPFGPLLDVRWILGITVSSRASEINSLSYFGVHVSDFASGVFFAYARI